ncbi:MAG: hypothetical protein U1E65_30085 [Myxococcota bacterium]
MALGTVSPQDRSPRVITSATPGATAIHHRPGRHHKPVTETQDAPLAGLAKTVVATEPAVTGQVHPSAHPNSAPSVPHSIAEAQAVLAKHGVHVGARPSPDSPEVPIHHAFLAKTYNRDGQADYQETVADQRTYLKNDTYLFMPLYADAAAEKKGSPLGENTGMKFATGAQIDYVTILDGDKPTRRDKEIGMATIALMTLGSGADRAFVEVDSSFKKPYTNAGFETFAGKASGRAYTQLMAECQAANVPVDTLEMLSFDFGKTKPSGAEKAALWKAHVAEWYQTNWDGITDAAALKCAEQAQRLMSEAADKGRFIWIQALPNRE